jgi:hypothetical protein
VEEEDVTFYLSFFTLFLLLEAISITIEYKQLPGGELLLLLHATALAICFQLLA